MGRPARAPTVRPRGNPPTPNPSLPGRGETPRPARSAQSPAQRHPPEATPTNPPPGGGGSSRTTQTLPPSLKGRGRGWVGQLQPVGSTTRNPIHPQPLPSREGRDAEAWHAAGNLLRCHTPAATPTNPPPPGGEVAPKVTEAGRHGMQGVHLPPLLSPKRPGTPPRSIPQKLFHTTPVNPASISP